MRRARSISLIRWNLHHFKGVCVLGKECDLGELLESSHSVDTGVWYIVVDKEVAEDVREMKPPV